MSLSMSYRPLTPSEWIEYLNKDFHGFFPINKGEKMPVCYDVEWDFDGPDGLLCSMTGSYTNGNKLIFTFKRDAPKSISYTYTEVLEILKKNLNKDIYLLDLDNHKESPAYYGCFPGCTFFSVIAGSKPQE